MSACRRSLGRINGVGIESRIELSLESIETLIAEIECPVAIKSERNVRIGSQTRGSAISSNKSRNAGRKIHRIEIVAEVGHIEISTDFCEIEGIESQWLPVVRNGAEHCFLSRGRIDLDEIAGIGACRCQA